MMVSGAFAFSNPSDWTQAVYNFASPHDNRLSMSNGKIRFDDKFSLAFPAATNNLQAIITYDSDSSTKTIMSGNPWWSSSGTCSITLLNDNKIFYLSFECPNLAFAGFIILKTNTNSYVAGGITNQSSSAKNINSVVLYDCIDKSIPALKFSHIAPFTLITPQIMLLDKVPIITQSGTVGNLIFSDNAYSCTNVGFGNTITIEGKNYYCIGSNLIVPLDTN